MLLLKTGQSNKPLAQGQGLFPHISGTFEFNQ